MTVAPVPWDDKKTKWENERSISNEKFNTINYPFKDPLNSWRYTDICINDSTGS